MIGRRTSVALILAALAAGCGGDSECGGGAHSTLSVWAEKQQQIGAAFKLVGAHPGAAWRLVVVHEGKIAWRGSVLAGPDGALKHTHRMGDYRGVDHVSVRAYGPDGATCAASADLSDDT